MTFETESAMNNMLRAPALATYKNHQIKLYDIIRKLEKTKKVKKGSKQNQNEDNEDDYS